VNGKNAHPGGTNFSAWDNSQVTAWIPEARATTDRAKRAPLYVKIQEVVHQELPIIPLYTANGIDLWYSRITGLHSVDSLTGTMESVENARITG
jgi:peptide/nickel transport system substrate-binding protein